MLGEHVEGSGPKDLWIELAVSDRVERGARLEIFEAVARDDGALARFVETVIGTADALQQTGRALGRSHLDYEVDIAPIDAEIEARRCDEAAQSARCHRRFDLAASLDRQAAMVDADRQALLILFPQLLEDQLREAARVAEYERGLVLLDQPHHVGDRMISGMAAPWDLVLGDEDREIGFGAGVADDEIDEFQVCVGSEPGTVGIGVADRCREADPA